MSCTIRPNIWMKRRYASQAKRSLFVSAASPLRVSSFNPRLRTVSIIPGIDIAAPERTETSNGSAASPRRFPVARSTAARPASTCAQSPGGRVRLLSK